MADQSSRNDFIEGVQEIFTTLFNNGSEGEDGIFFYALSDRSVTNVYGESKEKVYKNPVMWVSSISFSPEHGVQTVEGVKRNAVFKVPLKSLRESGYFTDGDFYKQKEDMDKICRGVIRYKDTYYEVLRVEPRTYVEDTFLIYQMDCKELLCSSLKMEDDDFSEGSEFEGGEF